MGDVVNLNKFRKENKKETVGKQAKENRIVFGRTKQDKNRDTLATEKTSKSLSGKKLKNEDGSTKDPKK
ncbi:MAG: DUF4169 family protein [Sneathiella sp.]